MNKSKKIFIALILLFILIFVILNRNYNIGEFPFERQCKYFMLLNRDNKKLSNDNCIISLMNENKKSDLQIYYLKRKLNQKNKLSKLDIKAINFLNIPDWEVVLVDNNEFLVTTKVTK